MLQLTRALDWPEFGGELSVDIPSVRYDEGVIDVQGQWVFDVFDGRVTVDGLRIERPFGVLPSLAADISVSRLDLEQLTSTFSFGRISGRLDGWVTDLRMLDWSPVSFDAWLGTPADQKGSRDISRRAVSNLTTIGGGSATAALTGPVIRLFSSFSYKQLGLGCRLANNVCAVRGLDDNSESVLIMQGSGIPRVTIRAYNRRMDWPQMVANLVAVAGDESVRIEH